MKEQQRQAYLDQIDYGRIERVIAYKNVQFIIDHQHDKYLLSRIEVPRPGRGRQAGRGAQFLI